MAERLLQVLAGKLFFDLVRLPCQSRHRARDFERVGRVRQLIRLNNDHLARFGVLDRESAVNHFRVVAKQRKLMHCTKKGSIQTECYQYPFPLADTSF